MITRIVFSIFLIIFLGCNRPTNLLTQSPPAPTQEAPVLEEPPIPATIPVDQLIEEAGRYVTLTEDQKLEIYQLADQYNYDRLSPQEQKAKRQELRNVVMSEILTPEQRRSVQEAMREGRQ